MTNFAENENHQVIVADNADIGLPVHGVFPIIV